MLANSGSNTKTKKRAEIRLTNGENLSVGDQICAQMKNQGGILGNFDHHGIYIGTGEDVLRIAGATVDGKEVVIRGASSTTSYNIPLRTFLTSYLNEELVSEYDGEEIRIKPFSHWRLDYGDLHVVRYHTDHATPEVAISRALSRLGERAYNLYGNNCDHFATWCSTGSASSPQMQRAAGAGVVLTGVVLIAAVAAVRNT